MNEETKEYSIQWVRGYIGSCDSKTKTIFLNRHLEKTDWAKQLVLDHETKHLADKGFYSKEDFLHDFKDGFNLKNQIPLMLWMLGRPETFLPFQFFEDAKGEPTTILVLWPFLVYALALIVLVVG